MRQPPAALYEYFPDRLCLKDALYDLDRTDVFTPSLSVCEFLEHGSMKDCIVERYVSCQKVLLERYGLYGGRKHGRFELFFPSGVTASERWYVDDMLWGRALDYYSEGNVRIDFGYKKGCLHGPFRLLREDGSLSVKGSFCEGLAHGMIELFTKDGLLIRSTSFVNGRRCGADAGLSDDGYLLFLDSWVGGQKRPTTFCDCIERYVCQQ